MFTIHHDTKENPAPTFLHDASRPFVIIEHVPFEGGFRKAIKDRYPTLEQAKRRVRTLKAR